MTVKISEFEGESVQEKLQRLLMKVVDGSATLEERREMTRLSLKLAALPKQTREELRAAKVARMTAHETGRILAILEPLRRLNGITGGLNEEAVMALMGAVEVYVNTSINAQQYASMVETAEKRIQHRLSHPIVRHKKAKV